MTEELNENIDSQNDDVEVDTTEGETTTGDSNAELTDREKQFLARAKKAEGKLKEVKTSIEEPKPEINKETNTEPSGLTIEHVALMQQGANVEKLKFAEEYAQLKGVSLTDAYNSAVAQAEFKEMDNKERLKTTSLGASNGSAPAPREKSVGNMTDAEHRAFAESKLSGAING